MAQHMSIDATSAASVHDKPAKSVWRRVFDTWMSAREAQADREIGRYIEARGGQMTDEIEREISRKYGRIVGE